MIIPADTYFSYIDNEQRDSYIAREMRQYPKGYAKPRCNSFIDFRALYHVICDTDRPAEVSYDAFMTVLDAVIQTIMIVPFFSPEDLNRFEAEGKLPHEQF